MNKLYAFLLLVFFAPGVSAQNLLHIPDTLSGTSVYLQIKDTSHTFYPGFTTATMGINDSYLGPTLVLHHGDSVDFQVENMLMDTTTIHWHGMHVTAMNDGGPHVVIPPGTIWNPSFTIRDHASMYWYHPHLHMMTNAHVSMGAAGLIIVRDTIEAALDLPRQYGVDDIPLVIQTKCFDGGRQILFNNASDSIVLVNSTVNAYYTIPAQVVHLRLLNAASERVMNLGFQSNMQFYQIGSDGGLLHAPVALTRLRMAPGERAEVLIDASQLQGQTLNMMSFAAELPSAMYGASQPGMGPGQTIPGYATNPLNGVNYQVLQLQVTAPTNNPVLTIPAALVMNTPYPLATAQAFRALTFSPANMGPAAIQGPFLINNVAYDHTVINYTIPFDNIEVWTLTNQSPIAHPFHIHDVQFYITEINGVAPPANMAGRKDVVLVPAMQTVKFITRFETFCDSMMPYMYHCHMLTHEDEGMMGQFVVSCPVGTSVNELPDYRVQIIPNPASGTVTIQLPAGIRIQQLVLADLAGRRITNVEADTHSGHLDLGATPSGIYVLTIKLTDGNIVQEKLSVIR